jgi:hypothetical protein
MAQPANQTFVDESRERIQQARTRVDSEIRRAQKELNQRRKRLEKQIQKNRKSFEKNFGKNRKGFEKRARKQVDQLRKDWEKNPVYKQLNRLYGGAEEQIESLRETLLGTFGIATRSDVKKIDRKLSKISKQLKQMESTKGGPSATL